MKNTVFTISRTKFFVRIFFSDVLPKKNFCSRDYLNLLYPYEMNLIVSIFRHLHYTTLVFFYKHLVINQLGVQKIFCNLSFYPLEVFSSRLLLFLPFRIFLHILTTFWTIPYSHRWFFQTYTVVMEPLVFTARIIARYHRTV